MIVYWVKKIQHSLYFYGNISFLNRKLSLGYIFGCVGKFKITKLLFALFDFSIQSLGYSFPFRVSKILRGYYKTNFTFSSDYFLEADDENHLICQSGDFRHQLQESSAVMMKVLLARGPPKFQAYRKVYKRRPLISAGGWGS